MTLFLQFKVSNDNVSKAELIDPRSYGIHFSFDAIGLKLKFGRRIARIVVCCASHPIYGMTKKSMLSQIRLPAFGWFGN